MLTEFLNAAIQHSPSVRSGWIGELRQFSRLSRCGKVAKNPAVLCVWLRGHFCCWKCQWVYRDWNLGEDEAMGMVLQSRGKWLGPGP